MLRMADFLRLPVLFHFKIFLIASSLQATTDSSLPSNL